MRADPEKKIINEHFAGRRGRFLEIGAHDGVTDSLTADLVARGWTGVQVEPNPLSVVVLAENRKNNPGIAIVNAAISNNTKLSQFWVDTGPLCGGYDKYRGQRSTLNRIFKENSERIDAIPYALPPLWVHPVDVKTLLATFGGPLNWQLLVIDAEFESCNSLRQFPLADMVDTELICVEWELSPKQAIDILQPWYTCQHIDCNVIGIRK